MIWPFRCKSRDGFRHLVTGASYIVVKAFTDHDGVVHSPGPRWRFLGHAFLPYEDGLTLEFEDGGALRRIRLQWRAEAEGDIIEALETYLVPAPRSATAMLLPMTRDSVCLADDVDAPHDDHLTVEVDADALAIARAVQAHNGLAYVGGTATWQIDVGADSVVFGRRMLVPFVLPAKPYRGATRARDLATLHVRYHAQNKPGTILAAIEAGRSRA